MTIKEEATEFFEVYYHPNTHAYSFKVAFKTLEEAESAIKKEYPGFDLVKESDAIAPFISITNKNSRKGSLIEVFYCKLYD